MWEKVDAYVKKHQMIRQGDRVLLGLSGGPDSVFLARYLLELVRRGIISLHIFHLNHLLRGEESRRDEDFVRSFCQKWNLPCLICREDISLFAGRHKCSVEEAGRMVRRRLMADYAGKTGCDRIAFAHHAGDQAETMLFRMIRGTGPEGLSGMLPVRGKTIRPLLCLEKEEIISGLRLLDQDYVEDTSNMQTDYSRNHIRLNILPEMEKINGQAVRHMACLAGQLREQNEYVGALMDRLYDEHVLSFEKGTGVSLDFFRSCSAFEQKALIRRMLFDAGEKRKDVSALHVELVSSLANKAAGRRIDLPHGLQAVRGEDSLSVIRQGQEEEPERHWRNGTGTGRAIPVPREKLEEGEEFSLTAGGGSYRFRLLFLSPGENLKRDCVKYFSYDKIKDKLLLRTRQEGDYLIMDRSGRKKLLRRYFIDEKIPSARRDHIILLAEGHHILWVTGGRTSEACKVSGPGQRVLRVIYTENLEGEKHG